MIVPVDPPPPDDPAGSRAGASSWEGAIVDRFQRPVYIPAGRRWRRLSSILKITLRCKLLKTQDKIAWLGDWDSNFA